MTARRLCVATACCVLVVALLVEHSHQAAQNEVLGVSAISSTDVWACGCAGYRFQGLIEHWGGTQWTTSVSPQPNLSTAYAVLAFPSGSVFLARDSVSRRLVRRLDSLILHTTQRL